MIIQVLAKTRDNQGHVPLADRGASQRTNLRMKRKPDIINSELFADNDYTETPHPSSIYLKENDQAWLIWHVAMQRFIIKQVPDDMSSRSNK